MPAAKIRILKPGDETSLEAFLLPRIESSMFLIGNLRTAGLMDQGRAYEGTYAARLSGKEITAVAAHYWNRMLVMQAEEDLPSLCRKAAKASGRAIGGLVGPAHQVDEMVRDLGIVKRQVQFDEIEDLFSLKLENLTVPEALSSGEVAGRRAESRDIDLITDWRIAYSVATLGAEPGPELEERCRVDMERSQMEGTTWILEKGGIAVSCSSFNAVVREAVQVGGVWTPRKMRGRGYARAVVARSLLDAREEGVETAILFTGKENIAAQKAYIALGFRQKSDYRLLILKSPVSFED